MSRRPLLIDKSCFVYCGQWMRWHHITIHNHQHRHYRRHCHCPCSINIIIIIERRICSSSGRSGLAMHLANQQRRRRWHDVCVVPVVIAAGADKRVSYDDFCSYFWANKIFALARINIKWPIGNRSGRLLFTASLYLYIPALMPFQCSATNKHDL